jgi:hypothetical protein
MRVALVLLLTFCLAACATYREDLNRGQRFYEEHQYERALAIFRYLEPDLDSLGFNDQARYAYMRGMTDYRLGTEFRPDARHWLAIAKAIEQEHPGGLTESWKRLLETALADLNREVYGERYQPAAAASSTPVAPDAQPPAASAAPSAEPAPAASPSEQPKALPAQPSCDKNEDCPSGFMCHEHECVQL